MIIFFKLLRFLLIIIRDIDGACSYYSRKFCNLFFKPRYEIIGNCNLCGTCCKGLAIYLSEGFWKYPLLKNLAIKWFAFLYHFQVINQYEKERVLLFRCLFLQENKCSVYKRRPFICRQYPLPRYFEKPKFIPNCGFSAQFNQKEFSWKKKKH